MLGVGQAVGIELHPEGLRLVHMQVRPGLALLHAESVPLPDGDLARLPMLALLTLDRLGLREVDIHLAFTPESGRGRHALFAGPKLRPAELQALALRELRRDGGLDPAQSFFAVADLGETDDGSGGRQRLLVGMPREQVEAVASLLRANGYRVRGATSAQVALLQSGELSELPPQGVVAMALLDPARSLLVVLEQGRPKLFRDIPTPSQDGAQDDSQLAEALWRELEISLIFYAQQFRPSQVDALVVVGATAVAERVAEWAEETERYRVVRFGEHPSLRVDELVQEPLSPFAVAMGTALSGRSRLQANLLPPELRSRPERLYALTLACLLALGFLAGTLWWRARLGNDAAALEQNLTAHRAEHAALAQRLSEVAATDARTLGALRWRQFLQRHDRQHTDEARLLGVLPEAMPANGRIIRLRLADLPPPPALINGRAPDKAAPPPVADPPTRQLQVEGAIAAADLRAAQEGLLQLKRRLEQVPRVASVELMPLQQRPRAPGADPSADTELPFTVNVLLRTSSPLAGGRP